MCNLGKKVNIIVVSDEITYQKDTYVKNINNKEVFIFERPTYEIYIIKKNIKFDAVIVIIKLSNNFDEIKRQYEYYSKIMKNKKHYIILINNKEDINNDINDNIDNLFIDERFYFRLNHDDIKTVNIYNPLVDIINDLLN